MKPATMQRLPRETMPRFALAMVAVLIGSAAVAEALWFSVYKEHARFVVLQLCSSGDRASCRAEQRDRIEWTVAFVPLVAVAGLIGAVASSWWRRRGLVSLPVQTLPSLVALNDRSAEAVNTRGVPMMWKPSRPIATARADGLTRRYLEVGPSLLAMSSSDPERAGAILRHEYAHHRNSDVVIARWSVATALVFAALTVWLVVEFWGDGVGSTLAVLMRALLLVLIAALARSAVLRAREFDADAFAAASAVDGDDGLARALTVERIGQRRWWAVARSLLAHHPEASVRTTMMADPASLRRPRLADAVLVGLTASIGAPVIASLVADWAGTGMPSLYAAGVGWAVIGVTLGCWLTAMLWANTVVSTDSGDHQLLAFGVTLAISILVGNLVFSSTIADTSVDLPRHMIDIQSSILIAAVLPVGVVWIAQLLDQAHRRFPDRPLLRGVPLLAAVLSVATIGALVATVGYVHNQALNLGANADLAATLGIDADLPTTIVAVASTWNQEWMAWPLPALALAGGIFFIARSNWRLLVVPLVAAAVSAAVLWGTREVFDITQRALDGGWYASSQVATLSPVIMGSAIAAIVVVGVVHADRGRVVLAGSLAVVSSILAALAAEAFVLRGDGDVLLLIRDILPIAVVAAMVLAALTGRGPTQLVRRAGWAGVGLGVTILAVSVGVASVSARPSQEVDHGHYALVLEELLRNDDVEQSAILAVLNECHSEVSPSTPRDATDTIEVLEFANSRPSTDELIQLHEKLIALIAFCRDGAQGAVDNDENALTPDDQAKLGDMEARFVDDLTRLFPEFATN